MDQAALAAASFQNISASWLSKAWPAASTLRTIPAGIAAASASTPSAGMYASSAPKWNSVGHETSGMRSIMPGTPDP